MTRFTRTLLLGCALAACDDGDSLEEPAAARFEIEITNISDQSAYPSGFSPGIWVLHTDADPLFTAGAADRDDGLEQLAEDGTPSLFARGAVEQGFFSANGGEDYEDAPIVPGETIRFEVEVAPETVANLNFAVMYGESNDWFLAPSGAGVALFDDAGAPIVEQDISAQVALWDAGTEVDQPFGEGPDQAPRQAVSGQGASEGVVAPTRLDPPMPTLAVMGGGVSVSFPEPVSGFVWVMHDDDFSPFEQYAPATSGLVAMTETGESQPLFAEWPVDALLIGAQEGPEPASAPIDPARPWLTLIARLADDPHHFVFCDPVRLVDADGQVRPEADVVADAVDGLRIWSMGPDPAVVRAVDVEGWPSADQLVRVVVRSL